MKVYIVLNNGRVDEVFDNFDAANAHRANLQRRWSIATIVAREVKSL